MGRSKDTKRLLLKALEKTPKSRRELEVEFGKDNKIKSVLKKLVDKGELKKEGKKYVRIVLEDEHSQVFQPKLAPIAMQMRKEASKEQKKSVKIIEPDVDIDDEIRRLEQELEASDSSDDSDLDSLDPEEGQVLSLSKFADDRVEKLPGQYLPEPGRYNPSKDGMKVQAAKRKGRASVRESEDAKRSSGLKQAVQEVLAGYKARSWERLPFYCRVCAKQYDNETEFFNHKETEFHRVAVETERKASYCRLCRKQLTSPEQMKEHLASRPHKDRLQKMKDRQQGGRSQRNKGGRQWV